MMETTPVPHILSHPRDLHELALSAGQVRLDILVSITFGKYSADVDIISELTLLFIAALLNAGAPDVTMSDLGKKCACPSRVGNIGRCGPA
jgi:hypothetical protein